MKSKKWALAALVVLVMFTFTGCFGKLIPVVANINGTELSSGTYLLLQFQSYREAMNLVEDTSRNVLKQDVVEIKDKEGGEEGETEEVVTPAKKWIEEKTEEYARNYIAFKNQIAEYDLELSEENQIQFDSVMETWEGSKASYERNGIGEETFKEYFKVMLLSQQLFEELYKEGGKLDPGREEIENRKEEESAHLRFLVVYLTDEATQVEAEGADDARIEIRDIVEQLNDPDSGKTLNIVAHQDLPRILDIITPPTSGIPTETTPIETDEDGEEILSTNINDYYISYTPDANNVYTAEFLDALKELENGKFGYYESEVVGGILLYEKLPVFNTDKVYEEKRAEFVDALFSEDFTDYVEELGKGFAVEWITGARWFYSQDKIYFPQTQNNYY